LETLNKPGIRENLLKFHQKYYSPNIMTLCVLGKGTSACILLLFLFLFVAAVAAVLAAVAAAVVVVVDCYLMVIY